MRIFRLLAVFPLIFIMSSCAPTVKNAADEIRLNSWRAHLRCGYIVKLSFNGDNAAFKILSKNKENTAVLRGLCLIDSRRIMIFDRADKDSYLFTYKLKDNKLSLGYDGGKIVLTRI